jgi:predicted GIY-YIG superfamily endonuclease
MSFWAYMLHCGDGSFYVGHTDDLDRRIAQHLSGEYGGYTSTPLPARLVWSDEFPSRCEALSAERQIKGWGRRKKLALIRGDWDLISLLARNGAEKGKERASTAQPERRGRESPSTTTHRFRAGEPVRAEPVEALLCFPHSPNGSRPQSRTDGG